MVVPSLPKKYKVAALLCALGLAGYGASVIWGENGLLRWHELRAELERQNDANFRLQRENERLRTRIERLEHDDAYLERRARELLGLARPGEILYRLATPTPRPTLPP